MPKARNSDATTDTVKTAASVYCVARDGWSVPVNRGTAVSRNPAMNA
jgi:hypothetical protein